MTDYNWQSGVSGNWTIASDWGGTVPNTPTADATIAASGNYTITLSAPETINVDSVTLNNAGATLNIAGTLNAGNLTVETGVASLSGALNTGAINLTGSGATLAVMDNQTLDNLTINLGNSSTGTGIDILNTATLTLGANATLNSNDPMIFMNDSNEITGQTFINNGQINVESYDLYIEPNLFINTGAISVASGAELLVNATSFVDTGTILLGAGAFFGFYDATVDNIGTVLGGAGAELGIDNYASLAALDHVSLSPTGTLRVLGTLDLGGDTFSALGAGTVELYGTIANGTIFASAPILFENRSVFENIIYIGALDVTGYEQGVAAEGSLTVLNPDGGLGTINLAQNNGISFDDNATLDNLVVNFGHGQTLQSWSYLFGGDTLTLGENFTLNSDSYHESYDENDINGGTVINEGQIIIFTGGLELIAQDFINAGTISVAAGATLQLGELGTSFLNTGLIELNASSELDYDASNLATGGTFELNGASIILGGQVDLNALNNFSLAGEGQVEVTGILDLDGAAFSPPTAPNIVIAATLANGTLTHADTGDFQIKAFDNITYLGNLDLTALGTPTLNILGTLQVESTTAGAPGTIDVTGGNQEIYFQYATSLDNTVIALGAATASNFDDRLYASLLTLGSGATLISNAPAASENYITARTITNNGVIDVETGMLIVSPINFINKGEIAISGGAILDLASTKLTAGGLIEGIGGAGISGIEFSKTNSLLSNGTLSAITLQADAGDAMAILASKGGSITTDSAVLILNGKKSEIEVARNINGGGAEKLEASLRSIGQKGALELLGHRGFKAEQGISLLGTIVLDGGNFVAPSLTLGATGIFTGAGNLESPITNAGKIEASGGKLNLTGPVSGPGSLIIATGAILELGAATSETVMFEGKNKNKSTLRLDDPTQFTGTLSNLQNHDVIDFFTTTVTAATLSGADLFITLSGGNTLDYKLAGAIANGSVKVATVASGTEIVIEQSAAPAMNFLASPAAATASQASLFAPLSAGVLGAPAPSAPTLSAAPSLHHLFSLSDDSKYTVFALPHGM